MQWFFRVFVTFFFFFSTSSLFASPSPADYGAPLSVGLVAISPSGKLMAFPYNMDDQESLRVLSLEDKKVLFSAASGKAKLVTLYFLNENQLFFSVSEKVKRNEFLFKFDLSTGFILDIPTGKIRQLLIPGDVILPAQSGLGSVVGTSPDGKYLYMPAYSDVNIKIPDTEFTLYKVATDKKQLSFYEKGGVNVRDFFVDSLGKTLVKEEFDSKKNKYTIYSKASGDWKAIFQDEITVINKDLRGLTPDSKSLLFIEYDESNNHGMLYSMDLLTGDISPSSMQREDADIGTTIQNLNRVVLGVVYDGFTPSYKFFDPQLDKRVQSIVAQFPEHSVHVYAGANDWNNIVAYVEGSSYLGDYFLFTEGKDPVFLTSSRSKIKTDDLNPIGKLTITARDGLKIPTLITIPKQKLGALKGLPAVVYPHGGPASHDDIGFDYLAQAWASQGYLVIQPQFRGSTGFGFKHMDAGFGEWGKKMQDDVTDTLKSLIAKGMVDPQKVCIAGASYGGYASLAGATFTPELYKCVIAMNGVSDIPTFKNYATSRGENYNRYEVGAYWEMQFKKGNLTDEDMIAVSPYASAAKVVAPILIVKSTEDTTVPPEQSDTMVRALKKANKEVSVLILEKENHHFERTESRVKVINESINFLNKHLGKPQ